MSRVRDEVKVADEVWIATALLHRQHPNRPDFDIDEIVETARNARMTTKLRPGVYVHALQHCVANRIPQPARYPMLVETATRRRRLWRPGDRFHPDRDGAKTLPNRDDIPSTYRDLLDWYETKYAAVKSRKIADPILALKGLGKKIWSEDPDS